MITVLKNWIIEDFFISHVGNLFACVQSGNCPNCFTIERGVYLFKGNFGIGNCGKEEFDPHLAPRMGTKEEIKERLVYL